MVFIIVNDFAHRLTKAGTVVSAQVRRKPGGSYSIGRDFVQMGPGDMGLTSGDIATIKQNLSRLDMIFPTGYVPPKSAQLYNREARSGSDLSTEDAELEIDTSRDLE